MKLAFANHFFDIKDDIDKIKALPVEYNPTSISDGYSYIKKQKNWSPYFSTNFMENNFEALQIDFGSHVEFCYMWDFTDEQINEFFKKPKQNEEDEKKKFATNVLNKIKDMDSIPYDVAVAINKMISDL